MLTKWQLVNMQPSRYCFHSGLAYRTKTKTAPSAFSCPILYILTVGPNQHLGQGQTKLILKTKWKKLRNQLELGGEGRMRDPVNPQLPDPPPGHTSGARATQISLPHPLLSAGCTQNSLQKTPKYLQNRLIIKRTKQSKYTMPWYKTVNGGYF